MILSPVVSVFAIAEAVLMSGTAAGARRKRACGCGGHRAVGACALLISIPRQFALAVRLLGTVSAILFAIVAARILGEQLGAPARAGAADHAAQGDPP
jgi:hypothetical protein